MIKDSTSFSKQVKATEDDEMLLCWSGILFDGRHPFIRADRLRLHLVKRSSNTVSVKSLCGYRPAAVRQGGVPDESDYSLMFDSRSNLVVIRGATSRSGRHALPEDLESWEDSTPANESWTGDLDMIERDYLRITPAWVRYVIRSVSAFTESQDIVGLDRIPLPDIRLVSSPGSCVFVYEDVDDPEDPAEVDGKLSYPATEYFGQGVLAVDPKFPVGHWFRVPLKVPTEVRRDISVTIGAERKNMKKEIT